MDAKLESWKGEHSESIVMDGVKIGKLETVKIPRAIVMDAKLESWKGEHSESIMMDGVKIGKLER